MYANMHVHNYARVCGRACAGDLGRAEREGEGGEADHPHGSVRGGTAGWSGSAGGQGPGVPAPQITQQGWLQGS